MTLDIKGQAGYYCQNHSCASGPVLSGYGPTDGPTDQRTDGPTDRRTDRPSYKDTWTHLKVVCKSLLKFDESENLWL